VARFRLISLASLCGLCFVAACKPQPLVLTPATLSFPRAFVGLDNVLGLDFELNGKPLGEAKFTVPSQFGSGTNPVFFKVDPPGPLGLAPLLHCTPTAPGQSSVVLFVTADNQTFDVLVEVNAVTPPMCAGTDPCESTTLDMRSGNCVQTPFPDGTQCGESFCGQSIQLCSAGVCQTTAVPDPIAGCPDIAPTPLTPTWTASLNAAPNSDVPGVVDANGNLYFLDDNGDIASIDAQGVPRWEQALPSSGCLTLLALMDDDLLIYEPAPCLSSVDAADPASGAMIWSVNDATFPVDFGNGSLAVAGGSGIDIIDPATGLLEETIGIGLAPTSLIGDGLGSVFGTVPGPDGGFSSTAFAIVAESGASTSWTVGNLPETPVGALALATDGRHVYFSTGQIFAAESGAVLGQFPDAFDVSGIVADPTRACLVADSARQDCVGSAVLACVDPSTFQPTWQCVLPTTSTSVETALLTGDEVALISISGSGLLVQTFDGTGHVVFAGAIPDAASWAVVGDHRLWVETGDGSVAAYDIPALDLVAHGWVTPGGNPAGTGAPR
jgi:hypothetical protein